MGERAEKLAWIRERLGGKDVIWFGPRGVDAAPMLNLTGSLHCFALTQPLLHQAAAEDLTLEQIQLLREETNSFDVDASPSAAMLQLRSALRAALKPGSVLMPYRASGLAIASFFPRIEDVRYFGVPYEVYLLAGHKAWAETAMRGQGVPVLPWRYFTDDDIGAIVGMLEAGPVVLRGNQSGGGEGVRLVRHASELEQLMPEHRDGVIAASPYLADNVPLNLHGCVFGDGTITLHAPSVQLIGIPQCVDWPFGYCGNDYAAVGDLGKEVLAQLEVIALHAGQWLHSIGFRGAFGLDAMLHQGTVYFIEINPRFQGSSAIAAELAEARNLPDAYMDQATLFLGGEPNRRPSLWELAIDQPRLAHVNCHSELDGPCYLSKAALPEGDLEIRALPAAGTAIAPGATMFNLRYRRAVTTDGLSVDAECAAGIDAVKSLFEPQVVEAGA